MPIEFRCTKCSKLLRTPDETGGKQARCPQCGTILAIPVPAAAPATPAPSPPTPAPAGLSRAALAPASANPYQSSTVTSPSAGVTPAAGYGKLDVSDAFARAWAIFKPNIGRCIGIVLLFYLCYMGLFLLFGAAIGFVSFAVRPGAGGNAGGGLPAIFAVAGALYVVALLANMWFLAGQTNFFLKVARGDRDASVSLLFGGSRWFLTVCGAGILVALAISLGWILCIVPGIIVGLMFSQFLFSIVDRDLGVLESLSESRRITSGNKGMLFVTFLIPSVIMMAASIAPNLALRPLLADHPFFIMGIQFGIQMVATVTVLPWFWVLLATCYLIMSGQPTADRSSNQTFG